MTTDLSAAGTAGGVPVLGVPTDSIVTVVPYAELPAPLGADLAAKVGRLGYLGGFFGLMAHQPDALLHFNRFTEALKDALPGELSEVVALTAAATAGNDYELVQHIRLARSHGKTDGWISAAAFGEADGGQLLAPAEWDVRALSRAALTGAPADAELQAVVTALGEPIAVAVLLLLGRYVAHAVVGRVLRLQAPVTLDPPLDRNRNAPPRRTP